MSDYDTKWQAFERSIEPIGGIIIRFHICSIGLSSAHEALKEIYNLKGLSKVITFKEYCDHVSGGFGDVIYNLDTRKYILLSGKFRGLRERAESLSLH